MDLYLAIIFLFVLFGLLAYRCKTSKDITAKDISEGIKATNLQKTTKRCISISHNNWFPTGQSITCSNISPADWYNHQSKKFKKNKRKSK